MPNYQFNVGRLFGIDTNGNPQEFGLLQDVTLDISRELKELKGPNAFAEVIALGSGKISGKASSAEFSTNNLNLMMAGMGDVTKGQYLMASELASLSSVKKDYTVTNAANFYKNLGAKDVSNPLNAVNMVMSANTKLTAPSTPTLTTSPTGGTIPAGSYSVKVAALNQLGYNSNATFDQQIANLKAPTSGVSAAAVAAATSALTGNTNVILASVAAVAGAVAYAWYVGLTGAETLQIVTTGNSINLNTIVTGGDSAPVADTTGIFDTGNYVIDPTTAGKYTFNQADAAQNKNMTVNYLWHDTSSGQIINLSNKEMGVAQYFSLFLSSPMVNKQGIQRQCNVWLNAVVSSKLALGWKLGDFQKPQFDFQASSDAANGLGWFSIGA